jgi:hypothetical protein
MTLGVLQVFRDLNHIGKGSEFFSEPFPESCE